MYLTKLNKNGASLIEIVAAVALSSICFILIYNMLSFNMRQNAINKDQSININIANSTLSYIKNKNFAEIKSYLESYNDGYYAQINVTSCNILFNEDIKVCETILSPIINNKIFDEKNLNIYIFPYNDPEKLNKLKTNPEVVFNDEIPDVLINYLKSIDTSKYSPVNINHNAVRVVVVVKSFNEKYDILVSGVSTNEDK